MAAEAGADAVRGSGRGRLDDAAALVRIAPGAARQPGGPAGGGRAGLAGRRTRAGHRPGKPNPHRSGRGRGALGLTATESRVAVLLTEGKTVGEVAEATGRGESTIRTHLKHMFAKHRLARRADLVRLVRSLAGVPKSRR